MSFEVDIGRGLSIALAFVSASSALARPSESQECTFTSYPLVQRMHQPDGLEIELLFRGDGANHWYEDVDGFPVVQTKAGYSYARRGRDGRLVATGDMVGTSDPQRLGLERRIVPVAPEGNGAASSRKARQDKRLKSTSLLDPGRAALLGGGSVKNLVLLLRFSDHGPAGQNRTLPSSADVATIMNAVGGDPTLAPTGSVRDHYLENSYGQFAIDSTVVGWLDVPFSEFDIANGNAGLTSLTWDLIIGGLDAADPAIDFADFDEDGDGWVDAITILHSGYGAEWGGSDQYGTHYSDRMWSHKWTIPTWTSAEGVKVGDYNISPGLWATSGSSPGRIGVVCHELGHFFGLPDLYDTDGSSQGSGNWDLMAAGAWGFDGSQQYPSHMSAWCKMKLGWVTPERLLPGSHSALQVEANPAVYMIDSGYPSGEYLLIENRQPVGFDGVIPQGGLAVWHVDEGKGSFSNNDPNNDEGYPGQGGWPGNDNHYRVELLQADGTYDMEHNLDRGDSGDVYRSGFAAVLDTATTPSTKAYQGGTITSNGNRLQGIGAASSSMPFTYVNASAPTITGASQLRVRIGLPYGVELTSAGGSAPFLWSEFLDDPSYTLTDLGPQSFTTGGTAQGFKADEETWAVDLPFAFPFYETSYSKVYVTPNGCVDLAPLENEYNNTSRSLRCLPRIAALWDDLTTNGSPLEDIYVDTSVSGAVRIRWRAEHVDTGLPANFAITLYHDGRIRFDYGSGNTGLTPTVGLSRGHSGDLVLVSSHDAQATLTNANSLEFALHGSQLPPGLTLSPAGVLSGTPKTTGTFQVRVRVRDSLLRYDQKLLTLELIRGYFKPSSSP